MDDCRQPSLAADRAGALGWEIWFGHGDTLDARL